MTEAESKILYEEYSGAELIGLLKEKNPKHYHPRLLVTAERFEEIARLKETDPVISKVWAALLADAEEMLEAPVSVYCIYDGIRLLQICRDVLGRVRTLGMAYRVTGEEKYAQRAWREVEAAAAFPDWNPYHFLDVGEMCEALALAYDWLYDWMSKEQRQILRTALIEKGLRIVMIDYLDQPRKRSYDWCHSPIIDNWTFVCNGGVALAALAIGDEEEEELCGEVLSQGLHNMERAFWLFAPDGAWREGLVYWNYATTYFVHHISALEQALGTDCGRFREPGLAKCADFVEALNGTAGIFNFSDCDSRKHSRPSQLLWFAKKLNRPEIAFNRIRDILAGETYYFSDLIWYDPVYFADYFRDERNEMPLDFYFDSIETAAMRSSWDENAVYVGFHGGFNGETHAHLDVGSFVLDARGERFFLDLGADDYNLPGGVFNRYRYRAEGHNTLVINPDKGFDQAEEGRGVMTCFESTEDGCTAVCDMTDAYREKVHRLTRTVQLAEGRSKVIVTDEVDVETPAELYWFAHTEAQIEIAKDGRSAILTQNGQKLHAEILEDEGCGLKWTVMDPKPLPDTPIIEGQAQNEGVQKLTIHADGFTGRLSVVFYAD